MLLACSGIFGEWSKTSDTNEAQRSAVANLALRTAGDAETTKYYMSVESLFDTLDDAEFRWVLDMFRKETEAKWRQGHRQGSVYGVKVTTFSWKMAHPQMKKEASSRRREAFDSVLQHVGANGFEQDERVTVHGSPLGAGIGRLMMPVRGDELQVLHVTFIARTMLGVILHRVLHLPAYIKVATDAEASFGMNAFDDDGDPTDGFAEHRAKKLAEKFPDIHVNALPLVTSDLGKQDWVPGVNKVVPWVEKNPDAELMSQLEHDHARLLNLMGAKSLQNLHRVMRLLVLCTLMLIPNLVEREAAAKKACDAIRLQYCNKDTISKLVDPGEAAQQNRLRVFATLYFILRADFKGAMAKQAPTWCPSCNASFVKCKNEKRRCKMTDCRPTMNYNKEGYQCSVERTLELGQLARWVLLLSPPFCVYLRDHMVRSLVNPPLAADSICSRWRAPKLSRTKVRPFFCISSSSFWARRG